MGMGEHTAALLSRLSRAMRAGGRGRTAALAAAPGLLALVGGQASCATALGSLALALAALVSLTRSWPAAGARARSGPLAALAFLAASGALLGELLLSLPAPEWLSTPTPGRRTALLVLALVAAGGFALAIPAQREASGAA